MLNYLYIKTLSIASYNGMNYFFWDVYVFIYYFFPLADGSATSRRHRRHTRQEMEGTAAPPRTRPSRTQTIPRLRPPTPSESKLKVHPVALLRHPASHAFHPWFRYSLHPQEGGTPPCAGLVVQGIHFKLFLRGWAAAVRGPKVNYAWPMLGTRGHTPLESFSCL